MDQAIESTKANCFRESMLKRNQTMKKLDNKKQLSHLMKKALTQVGAFLVNHKTVRFAQE